jgi:hypothetical protein
MHSTRCFRMAEGACGSDAVRDRMDTEFGAGAGKRARFSVERSRE